VPLSVGGGSVLTQHQSYDWIRTVNATLMTGHQANPVHCYKFSVRFAVHNILKYYFGTGEDDKKPGLIPGDTVATGVVCM
jgi:hypothetical protein